MKGDANEEDIGQLNVGQEEAKIDLYNENNNIESTSLEKSNQPSNRFTMVDNNFDEDESRENSLGLNKIRATSNSNFNEDINQNNNFLNNSNPMPTSSRSTKNKLSRDLNLIDIKIIILGEASVGKTSIIGRYIDNSFHDLYTCTIQAEKRSKVINEDENTSLRLNIWDTAGQEKFKSITRQYYRDAHGAIIVFDLTSRKSFDEVKNWIKELKSYGSEETVIIILGNKSDLSNERAVPEDDIRKELNEEYFYSDVSAKTGNNIILAFDNLKKSIMDNLKMKEKNKKDKNINAGKAPKKNLNGDIRDKDIQNIGQNKSNKCC
jgi:small GTP-binding protein